MPARYILRFTFCEKFSSGRVREDLAAAAPQRAGGHAGARAAGALLAPRLLGRVAHFAAVLLLARAEARVRRVGDDELVDQRLVEVAAEQRIRRVESAEQYVGAKWCRQRHVVLLVKIANDLRWMASGPRTGLAEIRLPDLQPGSSIMPGKVNPVIAEVVTQVGAQVMGNDVAIGFAGTQGNFELNVFVPLIAQNLLDSIALLTSACSVFAEKCVAGIEANVDRLKEYAESSPSIGTALTPHIGYEAAAEIIKESTRTGKSIRADRAGPQADDRRRARPGARRRGDDPRRHHRMTASDRRG